MKKFLTLTTLLLLLVLPAKADSFKVEPAFWWSGMAEPELQLMIYGDGVADMRASIDAPEVVLLETVSLESPNYLLLYVDISEAKPGTFEVTLKGAGRERRFSYTLREREPGRREVKGFSSEDVVYLIMPDRFVNGDPSNDQIPMRLPYKLDRQVENTRHGGDLEGVRQKLDYLADLGVTAVWLNPILENDMGPGSYHGYATTDYYKVDPRLGTNEGFRELVKEAHSKGLKVVMDMVFNHCGSEHIWLKDKPSKDWFNNPDRYVETSHNKEIYFDPYASEYDKEHFTDGWFVPTMPDLNQRNRHVAKYLIQNSIWWVEYAGIDGIRQDTHPYADYDMMARWCRTIEREYPQFNIMGEAWLPEVAGSAFWQKGSDLNQRGDTGLKTVMDFGLMLKANDIFFEETGSWEGGLFKLHSHLAYDFLYPDVYHVLRFLDNHDTDRFYKEAPTSLNPFKQGYTLLLTIPGIPQIYYGSEILMHGIKGRGDGHIRLDMPGGWEGDPVDAFTAEGRTKMQNEAFHFLRHLLHLRQELPQLTQGKMKHYALQNGVYLYERYLPGNPETIVVVMNGKRSPSEISLEPYRETLGSATSATDLLTQKSVPLQESLTLEPSQVMMLKVVRGSTN